MPPDVEPPSPAPDTSESVAVLPSPAVITAPPPPKHFEPDDPMWAAVRLTHGWDHLELFKAVRKTLFALPAYFKSDLHITGALASDLYTFNAALGASIEGQIVEALNELRESWDADRKYQLYSFARQSQKFPDVVLRSFSPGKGIEILMGIELKGWFVLAKEEEPTFRYKVTPAVCAPWDLLAVYPWGLSEVISGRPQLLKPFVTSARYAAESRNWYWQHAKSGSGNKDITLSKANRFYPSKREHISDIPASDSGKNFGRVARYGIMNKFTEEVSRETLSGIPIEAWQKFLAIFSEGREDPTIATKLALLAAGFRAPTSPLVKEDVQIIEAQFTDIIEELKSRIFDVAPEKPKRTTTRKPKRGTESEVEVVAGDIGSVEAETP